MPLPEPLRGFGTISLGPELSRLDEAVARYKAERDAGRVLANTMEAVRTELTYNSNAIEGSTLTLRETQLVIEGRAPDGKSMREIYEARNHDRALRLIEQWVGSRPAQPITERDLLDVHAAVLADIDAREAGRFRSGRVLIAGSRFVPPGPHKFAELIPLALGEDPKLHPVVGAAQLHYNLVAIHPFADGNGRTARLMMNYVLLRRGYPWVIIDVAERAEYMASLEEANTGKSERFVRFIVRSAVRTIDRLLGPA